MARYAVFVDGGYFKKVLKCFGEPRISYLKLSEALANGEERLRTYYYDCAPYVSARPTPEERSRKSGFDRFVAALELSPRFQVRLGRLAKYESANAPVFKQRMVDILLTLDLAKLSVEHQIQRAVLFAGDSDYVPAIQVARDAGVIVQLYYHVPPPLHDQLRRACDETKLIDQTFIDRIRQV